MRRLVDGYEPTGVAGSAEWPPHDSCPYDEHGNSSPISACRVGIRTTAQGMEIARRRFHHGGSGEMISAIWTSDTQTTISPGTLR